MSKRYITSDKPKMSDSFQRVGDYRYMPYTYKSNTRKPRVTKKMLLTARAKDRTIAVQERVKPISIELQAWLSTTLQSREE